MFQQIVVMACLALVAIANFASIALLAIERKKRDER